MNAAVRRVAVAALVLLGLLLVNVNYVQVVAADRLRKDPRNGRVLVKSYARERGQITTDRRVLVRSVETDDRLKYLRRYADGKAASAQLYAHVTGYYSLVYGGSGLEKSLDDVLSGEDERLFVRRVTDTLTGREPKGGIVELTLDAEVQAAAYSALAGAGGKGAVVAIDTRSGAILAMASLPTYDPNLLSSHDPAAIRKAYDALVRSPGQPLINRATQRTYPPGSVFKVVTAAAFIERLGIRPETLVPCPRRYRLPLTNSDLDNFGGASCGANQVPFVEAFRKSRNTTFAQLAVERLGADALRETAEAFGFGRTPELSLPADPAVFPESLDKPQTGLAAIGQYDVRVTPLQMAMVAAGIANRGQVMTPYVVRRVLGPDLRELDETRPRRFGDPAVREGTAAIVRDLMVETVRSGTGRNAALPGVTVAGKTGTAQTAPGRPPHVWFVGFAPAEAPRIAVAVVVENGGAQGTEATGGVVAAPVARAVLAAALAQVRS